MPEAKSAWQLRAYAAIMDAYERVLADYGEQVASAQIEAGVQIQGRNPDLNRKIEQDELKKAVLRLLTDTDPMFTDFLRAGAARVIVPAHPAYGDLDADLPACAPDSEYPCLADEWEIKLPTTLVYLQEDAQLPDFTS